MERAGGGGGSGIINIEYDLRKDAENRRKHTYSLAAAEAVFEGPFIEEEDVRADYGETRFIAIGPLSETDDRLFVTVYTWRSAQRRIISFRKANAREVRKYRDSYA